MAIKQLNSSINMKHSISFNKLSSTIRRSSAKLLQKIKSTDYYPDLISFRLVEDCTEY